jgi:putative endonuclease
MRRYYVYILASRSRRLYVGITSNPMRRLEQHREGKVGFTARYRIHRLVFIDCFDNPADAIENEKRVKAWRRSKKIALIEAGNPAWDDLGAEWFEPPKADPSLRSG